MGWYLLASWSRRATSCCFVTAFGEEGEEGEEGDDRSVMSFCTSES